MYLYLQNRRGKITANHLSIAKMIREFIPNFGGRRFRHTLFHNKINNASYYSEKKRKKDFTVACSRAGSRLLKTLVGHPNVKTSTNVIKHLKCYNFFFHARDKAP